MAYNIYRTLFVIGDEPEKIVEKYSLDTKVEPYVKYHREDSEKVHKKHIKIIENLLNSDKIKMSPTQKDSYKKLYLEISGMSDFDYYLYMSEGCRFDEENGDALCDENPNAKFKSATCPQEYYEKTGNIGGFSYPLELKDGTKAYTAHYKDIDWKKNHMSNVELYERVWEICVEGDEPKNDDEKKIKDNMSNSQAYFITNFADKDEYIKHSCSFWCYAVATDKKYEELDYKTPDKEWVANFYDKYVKTIKGNPLITIYEVKSLD